MLLGFVLVVMGITIYQERKTERALDALRDLSSPRALVIRDGKRVRIPGREVVPGDYLVLAEGDRVAADACLLCALNLSVDESILTGESVPVRKDSAEKARAMERPGGEDTPFVYSGTLVVQGQGIAVVQGTGISTEIGKIGRALESVEQEQTLLQKETGRLVRNLAIVGISLCVVVVLVYWLTRGDFVQGLLAGITLAMGVLPEEFPVVLTVFLALGAWRMSQKRVLARRIPVIETLGSATVLCVDKTGTLTQNRMAVSMLFAGGEFVEVATHGEATVPEHFHDLMEYGVLACKPDPFDPMERALRTLGINTLSDTEHIHNDWTFVQEYPLSRELLALSHVWRSPTGDAYEIASKGAPEAIADLCHLTEAQVARLSEAVDRMASRGLRALGVARARFAAEELPEIQHDFNFEFLGLIGLADPIRPTVPEAVRECYRAGIRVIMITGDYPGTAKSIAEQIGLKPCDEVITGSELDAMSEEELLERVKHTCVFARVVPEQKLRLVNALKANGEIVAMTGDGVNDAPALKSAHIGIAMGARGTDVAREASSLVLLDDDFTSIVAAVKQGRRIFDNLRKAMAYILAIHVPIAGLSLIAVLAKWPLILLPVHVATLELIIDPSCSVVFENEPEEASVMDRPPRDPKEPLLQRHTIMLALAQGAAVLAIIAGIYAYGIYTRGVGELEARALAFTTLIFANVGLILTNRSWTETIFHTLREPNKALWWVSGGATAMILAVLYVPFLRSLFHFAPVMPHDLVLCLAGGLISVLWFEAYKVIARRRRS
jgi:Ca2+-transporting ATPase